jgi:sensor histidine kinase YesM
VTQAPLSNPKFRNLFAACWLLWTALQVQVLVWYGFPVTVAVIDSIISNVLLVGCCLLVSSMLRYYLPQTNRYSYVFGLCTVLTLIWFFSSRTLVFLALHKESAYTSFFSHSIPVRFAMSFLIIGCMTLISVLWYILSDQQEAERRRIQAEQLAKEAELYKLRQQLQPHFLFNSLNSINALVRLDPPLARTMIQQLSDFLRGTIKKEENTWISLEEELQHLGLYLDIEKVRFGHRLHAEIKNNAIESNAFLPAMLLQPIVENAIKFGLYDTTGNVTISITAEMHQSHLQIQVTNPYDTAREQANRGTGFGLRSVQRRLYLLFARNDLLQIRTEKSFFITTIKIPQRDKSRNRG